MVTFEGKLALLVPGQVILEGPISTQNPATYVTLEIGSNLFGVFPLNFVILPLLFHPCVPLRLFALFVVVFKVLGITSKVNWSLARRTMCSLRARVYLQDVCGNLLRKATRL